VHLMNIVGRSDACYEKGKRSRDNPCTLHNSHGIWITYLEVLDLISYLKKHVAMHRQAPLKSTFT
jgi:hypothetical protein